MSATDGDELVGREEMEAAALAALAAATAAAAAATLMGGWAWPAAAAA